MRTKLERYKRRQREREERSQRVLRLIDKRDMLIAMSAHYEGVGEMSEVRKLRARVRTIEQQVRYIGSGFLPENYSKEAPLPP
jgi:hypothetical protein